MTGLRFDGVPTSVTAFLGVTQGDSSPSLVASAHAFASRWPGESALASAVTEFFRHGGTVAWIAPLPESTPAAVEAAIGALDADVSLVAVVTDPPSQPEVIAAAAAALAEHPALLLVEGPWTDAGAAVAAMDGGGADTVGATGPDVVVYWPRLQRDGTAISPLGPTAGMIARHDVSRGFFRAPAGADGALEGLEPVVAVTSSDADALNRLGVNVIRSFPGRGTLVWGARTLTTDQDWRYIPVRRTALFVEESVRRGLQTAVFEPNDEPLWGAVRAGVGRLLHDLFRRGAFAGRTADEAYFVRCDASTTTAADIAAGELVVMVGFAPLKPAEFVVLTVRSRTAPS